jgi:hypothetical protein
MGSQLLEIRKPPFKKRAVSEAQSVLAACSDRTSKNGSSEHYTCKRLLLGEWAVDEVVFIGLRRNFLVFASAGMVLHSIRIFRSIIRMDRNEKL